MGSTGVSAGMVNSSPGTISYAQGVTQQSSTLTDAELSKLRADKDFSFNITMPSDSTPVVHVMADGQEIAIVRLYYKEAFAINRFRGTETAYKTLQTAIDGIRRQYKK